MPTYAGVRARRRSWILLGVVVLAGFIKCACRARNRLTRSGVVQRRPKGDPIDRGGAVDRCSCVASLPDRWTGGAANGRDTGEAGSAPRQVSYRRVAEHLE